MITSKNIINNIPLALRLLSCPQFTNSKNVCNQIQRGYNLKLLEKRLQNVRYMCNISNKTSNYNDKDLEKLYYGVLTPQIKAVKVISFTTSIGGLLAQPIILQKVTTSGGSLAVIIGLCTFLGFFTFITPLLLHFITKKYITHLDYNPKNDKYIATVLTFFCRQQKIEFSVDDVKVPEIPGMFTTFQIKGKPFFVDPSLFSDPTHYGKLMGYNKPIDFKLYQTESDDKKL